MKWLTNLKEPGSQLNRFSWPMHTGGEQLIYRCPPSRRS
jgi:hypothetical protein